MVANITSLTGNGLKDWLIQRVTAIYFGAYCIFLLVFFVRHPHLQFQQWHDLFSNPVMQVTTVIGLLALTLHSWIGMWTVTTDYLQCTAIRLSLQLLIFLGLLGQFIWGILIVWGQ